MRTLTALGTVVTLLAGSAVIAPAADPPPSTRVSYVTLPTLHADAPLTLAGRLMVPRGAPGKVPAVLIVHGSAGPDSRGPLMADVLARAGMATLEIDMWAARGLKGGPAGRPKDVAETLPDAFGALKFLANHPAIDPERIGITGFSWGGVVSMLTASKPIADQYAPPALRFKAHAPFYPVCWIYNQRPDLAFKELTGAPVFMQGGELDTYDEPDTCQKLVDSLPEATRRLVRLKMYSGATHMFDSAEPEQVFNDPFAHLGRGGEVRAIPNPVAATMAREATAKFFAEVFGLSR